MASILIVDDSKFMRKVLSDILTKGGHEIVGEAENAKEALELREKLKPDLVTLDIIMPEVEGVDAVSAIRAMRQADPHVEVVMVSSVGQEKVMEECLREGAADFVVKPFSPADIVGTVAAVMKRC